MQTILLVYSNFVSWINLAQGCLLCINILEIVQCTQSILLIYFTCMCSLTMYYLKKKKKKAATNLKSFDLNVYLESYWKILCISPKIDTVSFRSTMKCWGVYSVALDACRFPFYLHITASLYMLQDCFSGDQVLICLNSWRLTNEAQITGNF